MFVCLCNALREQDCHAAAAHPDTCCAGCVYRRLGCRVRCGACVPLMRDIVAHAKGAEAATTQGRVTAAAVKVMPARD